MRKVIIALTLIIGISFLISAIIVMDGNIEDLEERVDELENRIGDIEDCIGDWRWRTSNSIKDDIGELEYRIEELESGFEILDNNVYRNHRRLNNIEWK